jgi:hypothetical protein
LSTPFLRKFFFTCTKKNCQFSCSSSSSFFSTTYSYMYSTHARP